jgi:hypothetical protein
VAEQLNPVTIYADDVNDVNSVLNFWPSWKFGGGFGGPDQLRQPDIRRQGSGRVDPGSVTSSTTCMTRSAGPIAVQALTCAGRTGWHRGTPPLVDRLTGSQLQADNARMFARHKYEKCGGTILISNWLSPKRNGVLFRDGRCTTHYPPAACCGWKTAGRRCRSSRVIPTLSYQLSVHLGHELHASATALRCPP